jgi:hypothetical protein
MSIPMMNRGVGSVMMARCSGGTERQESSGLWSEGGDTRSSVGRLQSATVSRFQSSNRYRKRSITSCNI